LKPSQSHSLSFVTTRQYDIGILFDLKLDSWNSLPCPQFVQGVTNSVATATAGLVAVGCDIIEFMIIN